MGLGTWPAVGLAEARKERDKWAAAIRAGQDPISQREAALVDAKAQLDKLDPTFQEMALMTLEAKKAGLRGGGMRGRWLSPLTIHIFPAIGTRRMSQIHQADIRDALKRIWITKHPTAKKAIERTRMVFQHAKLTGIECDPDTVDAARHMLGEVLHKPQNLPALPWQEVPALFESLGSAVSHLCIKWVILTAVRGFAARGARFDEIEGNVWTVPADRMKGKEGKAEPFRVPLSTEAMKIIAQCEAFGSEYLFPSNRSYQFVSDVALTKELRKRAETATVHGFRTSFKTWAQDNAISWEVSETILAHTIGDKVERAYARSDILERRAVVMQSWGEFVAGEAGSVVRLRG